MGSGPVVVGKEWWWWVVRYSRRDRDDLLFDCAHGEFMKCLEKEKWKTWKRGGTDGREKHLGCTLLHSHKRFPGMREAWQNGDSCIQSDSFFLFLFWPFFYSTDVCFERV